MIGEIKVDGIDQNIIFNSEDVYEGSAFNINTAVNNKNMPVIIHYDGVEYNTRLTMMELGGKKYVMLELYEEDTV